MKLPEGIHSLDMVFFDTVYLSNVGKLLVKGAQPTDELLADIEEISARAINWLQSKGAVDRDFQGPRTRTAVANLGSIVALKALGLVETPDSL